jgi:hypothetical protein
MRTISLLAAAVLALAGCLDAAEPQVDNPLPTDDVSDLGLFLEAVIKNSMNFTGSTVTAAVGYALDLYEPTMEVSDTGVIYVTGHTIAVDTTGAPVFFSKDDGKTWKQLPFLSSLTMPHPIHGATPPPSDEIFLVAGENGQLWGVDITLLTFPVNGWCNNGAEHCYHNPDAYDVVQAQTSRVQGGSCSALNLNDRPWVAYGKGKLLLVNNPGGGPVQVGLMDVPTLPVGGPGGIPTGATWNLCAGKGGGRIPGIPDMRPDHFFAVPQVQGDELVIVKGKGDVMNVQQKTVFKNTNVGGGTSNYGQVVFDAEGTMFIGIKNNTRSSGGPSKGQLHLAISQDDGETFSERTLRLSAPTTSVYLDGNKAGRGALLTWAQQTEPGTADWYAGHMFVGPDGAPVVENVSLILGGGPLPSAHVQGAAVGPDGRAYIVTYEDGYSPTAQATPLKVWIQKDGPTMPVAMPKAVPIAA